MVAAGTNDYTGNMPRDIAADYQRLLSSDQGPPFLQLMLQQRQSLPRLSGDVTYDTIIVQELCESRGGRPGLSVLTSLLVSVDVKIY